MEAIEAPSCPNCVELEADLESVYEHRHAKFQRMKRSAERYVKINRRKRLGQTKRLAKQIGIPVPLNKKFLLKLVETADKMTEMINTADDLLEGIRGAVRYMSHKKAQRDARAVLSDKPLPEEDPDDSPWINKD
jgi:hypothetical protein